MKNLKTIVATAALTAALSINSFAGIILTVADQPTNRCENQKSKVASAFTGIILTFTGIILTFSDKSNDCKEVVNSGILITD